MNAEQIRRIETMMDRELSAAEKERLGRIQTTLGVADNDALWEVLAALEYERTFYQELPQQIGATAKDILRGITSAADKEAAAAQARLADCVVQQAQRLSEKINYATLVPMGIAALVGIMLFGSLMMWAGYCFGSREVHDIYWVLRMPSGFLTAGIALAGGLCVGFYAVREYAYEEKILWKQAVVSLVLTVGAMVLVRATLFW